VVAVNLSSFLFGLGFGEGIERLGQYSNLLRTRGLVESAGFSAFIAVVFLLLFQATVRAKTTLSFIAAVCIGFGYVGMYSYQRPNMPAALDPALHPLFEGIPKGAVSVTLEDCTSKTRSWYRSEANQANLRAIDGPTDVGIFRQYRKFWAHWNDVEDFNAKGANLMEVLWICADKVLDKSGKLNASFSALASAVGLQYVFTESDVNDASMTLFRQVGGMRAYRRSSAWTDVSFLPGIAASDFASTLSALAIGDSEALRKFLAYDSIRIPLASKRQGNLFWAIDVPPALRGSGGTLFMNHPLEYHRGLIVPFLNIPLDGRWVLSQGDRSVDFPLGAVPYRVADAHLTEKKVSVEYGLEQYYFWFLMSFVGIVGAVCLAISVPRQKRV